MALQGLRSKPTYKGLLKILNDLEIKPKSWNEIPVEVTTDEPVANKDDVQKFLLNLFKTDFSWFEDEDGGSGAITAQEQKDEIVDMASRRLAERCGRSARGQDTRTFKLDVPQDLYAKAGHSTATLELQIREPPLTGDNLGLKTWGSAWTMVQLLPELGGHPSLQKLLEIQLKRSVHGQRDKSPTLQVLELGAGTGLVGMAAAALWGVNVVLTDLPVIHENLQYNVNKNTPAISHVSNGHASAEVLDWNNHEGAFPGWPSKEFEVILAVDPLYDDDHPQLLAKTIKKFIKRGGNSVVLTAVPFRDSTTQLLCLELETLMKANGFENIHGGENICRDDWESASAREVMVRWALWLDDF